MKIVIVEDEENIREGILSCLDWKQEGFEQVNAFSSALEALQYMEKEEAEVMITDIYMPVIDGLELIRMARQLQPGLEVLILTGHNKFELAQEAIGLSVKRYLLKPVSAKQLSDALQDIRNEIREKVQLKDWISIVEKRLNKYLPIVKNQFWNDMIHAEHMDIHEILNRAKEEQIPIDYPVFVCLAADCRERERLNLTLRMAVQQILERLLSKQLIYLLWTEGMALAILSEDVQEERLMLLQKSLEENLNLHFTIGVSLQKEHVSKLGNAASEAIEAAKTGVSSGGVVSYSDIVSWKERRKEYPFELENRILDMIRFHDEMEQGPLLQFLDYVMPPQHAAEDAKMMLIQLLAAINLLGHEYCKKSFEEFKETEKSIERFDKIQESFLKMVSRVIAEKNSLRERCVERMVQQTKNIIEKEYGNPELNVKLLAERLSVTPNYLSRVFSESSECTCIEYLTRIRMDAAGEMLMHSDKRSYEIGLEVGYQNANYFSALFKKYTGMSPKEFREQTLADSEG